MGVLQLLQLLLMLPVPLLEQLNVEHLALLGQPRLIRLAIGSGKLLLLFPHLQVEVRLHRIIQHLHM